MRRSGNASGGVEVSPGREGMPYPIRAPFDYASEPKEEVLACNLCGAERSFVLARRDRYGHDAISRQCGSCGLVWLSPRMTAEGYRRFYASGEYRRLVSAYHGREINADTVQEDQREYARWLGANVVGYGGYVLDVGGSTGVVGGHVGRKVTVLDPSEAELLRAAEAGCEGILGTAEDWDPKGRDWDLILVCRTVDHFLDIGKALETLKRALAPGGRLWIDAVKWREVAADAGRLEGAFKIDHPFALTVSTLQAYLVRAGFRIVSEHHRGVHRGFLCE